jgi:ribonuclease T2
LIKIRRNSPIYWIALALLLLAYLAYQYYTQNQASPASQTVTETATQEATEISALEATDTPVPTSRATPLPVTRTPAASSTPGGSTRPSATSTKTAKFDYYVLALSWAPDYCATSGSGDVQECAIGKKLGFVLHGLWPQYASGYPSTCSTEKLPDAVQAKYPKLYPNDNLYTHEWEKHGTCSGLSPDAYLTFTKKLKDGVVIPDALKAPQTQLHMTVQQMRQAFQQANPTLNDASVEMNCSSGGKYLQEVYVCFTRDGAPTACGSDVHKDTAQTCPSSDFLVRNVH